MSKYKLWKSFEQETVRELTRCGFDSMRNWSKQFEISDGVDVKATDGEHTLLVQCKHQAKPNMRIAYQEAKTGVTGKNEKPVAKVRFTGTRETYAVLSWKDFLGLLKREW